MNWFGIANFWSCNATTMHLTILRSWSTMHLNKDLDIVLFAPVKDLIDIGLVLSWGHSLQVSESILNICWSIWCNILAKIDPVPVASWNSEHFDAP